MVYAITYDLNRPGQNYPSLYRTIEGMGQTDHPLQNLWLVDTNLSADSIRDSLRSVIDPNDFVFVCKVEVYSAYMPRSSINWLQGRI